MDYKAVARNGIAFLERVNLTGKEVSPYLEVNRLLGQIMEGTLTVVPADPGQRTLELVAPQSQQSE